MLLRTGPPVLRFMFKRLDGAELVAYRGAARCVVRVRCSQEQPYARLCLYCRTAHTVCSHSKGATQFADEVVDVDVHEFFEVESVNAIFDETHSLGNALYCVCLYCVYLVHFVCHKP